MKRVGNLFDKVVSRENLQEAFLKASRGKRHRKDQQLFAADLDRNLEALRKGLLDGTYPIGNYTKFVIYDPKEREICAAPFDERVLQHALVGPCEGFFEKWMIYDSYASRRGKGLMRAVRRAQHFAHGNEWFLKCDIRKYFDSIPHAGIMRMLKSKIKDEMLLYWFDRILSTYETESGKGLPIGNLTSQHFANLYLDSVDRMHRPYVRYMDDFIFWSKDKNRLLQLRGEISAYLKDKLGVELKESSYVNRTSHGVDFLGMRVYPGAVRPNRVSRVRFTASCRNLRHLFENGMIGEIEYQDRLTSLTAFLQQGDGVAWRRRVLSQLGV